MKATTKRLLALVLVLCTMLALGMRTVPYAQAAEELPEGIVYGAADQTTFVPAGYTYVFEDENGMGYTYEAEGDMYISERVLTAEEAEALAKLDCRGDSMVQPDGTVCKTFSAKNGSVEALRGVSLSIGKGEIFGVIGLSGAGKSTLVRCMNLLERPDSGDVLLNGESLLKLNKEQLRLRRQKIGMIFQHFNLLEQQTVLENVCFPMEIRGIPKKERREKALELLKKVGLSEKAKAYPAQLSGGQKQRVAIARVLANEPEILLCDEATSALDPETTQTILRLLKTIRDTLGITIVVITHEMRVIQQVCTRVAVLDGGLVQPGGCC